MGHREAVLLEEPIIVEPRVRGGVGAPDHVRESMCVCVCLFVWMSVYVCA